MSKPYKMDIELFWTDFSKWDHLSNETISLINGYKKHVERLNNMAYLMSIPMLLTLFMSNLKYHEYVFLLLSIIVLVSLLYLITSKIKTLLLIKYLLIPKKKLKQHSNKLKVRIYFLKFLDRVNYFLYFFIFVWTILTMISNVNEIL